MILGIVHSGKIEGFGDLAVFEAVHDFLLKLTKLFLHLGVYIPAVVLHNIVLRPVY
jgi:hypothetical protein